MPGEGRGSFDNALLRGMFGAFQSAATSRLTTADVWDALRHAAGSWQLQARGQLAGATEGEIIEAGRQTLSAQGVGIREVNDFRALAGQWRTSQDRLQDLGQADQITAGAIFQPPWAQTGQAGVPQRLRARVRWQITPEEGEVFDKWTSIDITAPALTTGDLIDQATRKAVDDKYIYLLSGGAPPTIQNIQLEQL